MKARYRRQKRAFGWPWLTNNRRHIPEGHPTAVPLVTHDIDEAVHPADVSSPFVLAGDRHDIVEIDLPRFAEYRRHVRELIRATSLAR